MFARVTKFKIKLDHVEEARALFRTLEQDITALPGLLQFSIVMKDDGVGYILGFLESEEQANANAPLVRDIWMKFATHLEAIPVPEGYNIEGCWTLGDLKPKEV